MTVLIGIVVGVIVMFWLVGKSVRKDKAARDAAPAGSVRVESVKGFEVGKTVKRYAAEGWTVSDQTTAKSFLSNAIVTLTFRKN
jgi:myo-inositol catabolism protein IolC